MKENAPLATLQKKKHALEYFVDLNILYNSYRLYNDGALYNEDALVWLESLPAGISDLIIADPPYNFSKESWDVFDSWESYVQWSLTWIKAARKVLTEHGSIYIFGSPDSASRIYPHLQQIFFDCRWLVWHYRNRGSTRPTDWVRSFDILLHCRVSKEHIFHPERVPEPYNSHTRKYPQKKHGKTSMFSNNTPPEQPRLWEPSQFGARPRDVIDIPTTSGSSKEKTPHPTQKPEELIRRIILASSNETSLIIDPFIGSGTTAVAARQLARRWLGNDKASEYLKWATRRIELVENKDPSFWVSHDIKRAHHRKKVRCGNT